MQSRNQVKWNRFVGDCGAHIFGNTFKQENSPKYIPEPTTYIIKPRHAYNTTLEVAGSGFIISSCLWFNAMPYANLVMVV
jgi:hypothetical protein